MHADDSSFKDCDRSVWSLDADRNQEAIAPHSPVRIKFYCPQPTSTEHAQHCDADDQLRDVLHIDLPSRGQQVPCIDKVATGEETDFGIFGYLSTRVPTSY
jgi:hypothetical protein